MAKFLAPHTHDRCITDKPITSGAKCPKWEAKADKKTLKLTSEGQRTITAYFRDSKADKTPWGPGTTSVLYDKTPPSMAAKSIQLAGKYAGGNYTVTFTAAATDDKRSVKGSGVKDYVLVFLAAGKPKAKCTSGTALPLSISSDGKTGTASLAIPSADVSKHKFRLCARDNAGNVASGLSLTAKP
jgi:hypothetical protein